MSDSGRPAQPGGARRATRSTRAPRRDRPAPRRYHGSRRARRSRRHTHPLARTLGLTTLGALAPGSVHLLLGRRRTGIALLVLWIVLVLGGSAAALWVVGGDWQRAALDLAFAPSLIRVAALALVILLVGWFALVWEGHRLVRPARRSRLDTGVGVGVVGLVCLLVALPVLRATQYAVATADFVSSVFADERSATIPDDVSKENPWGDRERINILLLGGDGSETRDGVRTDTVMLLSVDTRTGQAITFSLPRNMMNAQFPPDSPLRELYPDGFSGSGNDGEYMLNAVYRNIPALHPGVLGDSANEGSDAIKQAVSGSLGVPVEYYVLVNLRGFQQVVDAMGGVTVNINERVAIGGDTDRGIPPDDYLEPGPGQHLDGFRALWFARGRWGSDDYSRMERQRCLVDAMVKAADPGRLLLRYLDLLEAGKQIVQTDIPQEIAPALVDLAWKVKDQRVRSVVFRAGDGFWPGDPDFDHVHQVVRRALDPPEKERRAETAGGGLEAAPTADASATPAAGEEPGEDPVDDPADACAYVPSSEVEAVEESGDTTVTRELIPD